MRRNATMLSWVAALALLLHAGAAAASIWCSMAGSLVADCACSNAKADAVPDSSRWEQATGTCCNEVVQAQVVEPGSYEPSLAAPLAVRSWEAPQPKPSLAQSWLEAGAPTATSPPLEQLATIVIVR